MSSYTNKSGSHPSSSSSHLAAALPTRALPNTAPYLTPSPDLRVSFTPSLDQPHPVSPIPLAICTLSKLCHSDNCEKLYKHSHKHAVLLLESSVVPMIFLFKVHIPFPPIPFLFHNLGEDRETRVVFSASEGRKYSYHRSNLHNCNFQNFYVQWKFSNSKQDGFSGCNVINHIKYYATALASFINVLVTCPSTFPKFNYFISKQIFSINPRFRHCTKNRSLTSLIKYRFPVLI